MVVGGGQVLLELAVGRDGRVTSVTPLRTTPPFTAVVADAVRDWQFAPATRTAAREPDVVAGRALPVESNVLVAGIFRPPAFNTPALGEAPRDVAPPSPGIVFPLKIAEPPFPPQAFGSGVVLVEARVDRDGTVADATIVRSAPPFDEAALAALRKWRFRPARVEVTAVPAFAYVLFGFPVPVGSSRGGV